MTKSQPRIKRTPLDLKAALVEQVTLLIAYCEHYDRGELEFCKPMATAVRVLLHQSKSSQSVLHQLGLRSGRYFTVAPPINPRNLLSECNLLSIHLSAGTAMYLPKLAMISGSKNRKPFCEWWTSPVAKAQNKESMSRMDIVQAVAGMDGGSHVDSGFTPLYQRFRSGEFLGWYALTGGEDHEKALLTSPQYACIRTIAHELLLTLKQYAPWCFLKHYVAESAW